MPSTGEEGFDTAELPDKFTLDIVSLGFYAMCADGVVSPDELDRFNDILTHLGVQVDEGAAEEALALVKHGHFEIPVTLVMFVLRACFKASAADPDAREAVLEEELAFLEAVLFLYATLMCSVVDSLGSGEKLVISTCLQTCCEYVTSNLGTPFALSERISALIG